MTTKFKRLTETAILPSREHPNDVGIDLRADIKEPIILYPGQRTLIPTGIAIQLDHGYEAQIRPRSGLAIKHGIGIINSPGTIDENYTGELKVILANFGVENRDVFVIRSGERIAQIVINKVEIDPIEEIFELKETDRGDKGFGSSGVS